MSPKANSLHFPKSMNNKKIERNALEETFFIFIGFFFLILQLGTTILIHLFFKKKKKKEGKICSQLGALLIETKYCSPIQPNISIGQSQFFKIVSLSKYIKKCSFPSQSNFKNTDEPDVFAFVLTLSACPNLPAGSPLSLQPLLLAHKPTELSRSVFITPQLQPIPDFS